VVWGCALVVLATGTGSARAAWDNVFQTCCWGCNSKPATSYYYAPPAAPSACCPQPACAPQPACTTRYVQRSYYQPVTTYKTETYYEPVTTYRTSYYYEPVTSVRYSNYYDPCTGCPQQVATPVTSYRLRSQCSPVTSYLARTACKPVTSYQMAYYYEPQTTCCQTSVGAPVYAVPSAGAGELPGAGAAPPIAGDSGGGNLPSTSDSSRKYAEPPLMPRAGDMNSFRQPQLGAPITVPQTAPNTPAQPAAVRLDKIVSLPKENVQGEVLGGNRQPRSNARILFVSADRQRTQEETTTDRSGSFRVSLASGNWLVYTQGADGRPVYHRKLEVRDDEPMRVNLETR
jgi:hypothetical protein